MDFKAIALGLVPTSIVVIINNHNLAEEIRRSDKDLIVYDFTTKERKPPKKYIHDLLHQHLGKIPQKRPKMHFQIDFLYSGETTPQEVVQECREFVHPGGWIIYPDKSHERYRPEPTWDVGIAKLKQSEKQFLHQHVSQLEDNSIYVEIGTYKGGSAVLAAVANPKVRIYAVDIWAGLNPAYPIFKRHVQFFSNIIPIKVDLLKLEEGPALIAEKEGIPLSKLKIDFLFVDGEHSYGAVRKDLGIYNQYATFVSGHDFEFGNDVHAAIVNYYAQRGGPFSQKSILIAIQKVFLKWTRYYGRQVGLQGADSSLWFRL